MDGCPSGETNEMLDGKVWSVVGAALLAAACSSETGGAGGSGGAAGEGGGAGGDDAASSTGAGAGTPAGPGLHATGEFNGEPVQIDCEPPTDLTVGNQFLYQQPGGLFDLWTVRCRTADGTINLWLDIGNPEAGTTKTQPEAGDAFNVALGDPYDIQPINRLAPNLAEMSLTIDEVDTVEPTLVGSFSASWDDDGSGKYGFIDGTFDLTGWE